MGLFGRKKEQQKELEKEYMSKINVRECLTQDFCMTIEDVFTIVGVGTVVVGTVETGMCRAGESARLEQRDGIIDTVITHIDIHTKARKPNETAYRTEHVGLALRAISKEQVHVGGRVVVKNGGMYVMG